MNPELSVILFAVDVGLLVILLAGAVWSVEGITTTRAGGHDM